MRLVITSLVLLVVSSTTGFPDGAPIDTCVKSRPNQPNHGQARPSQEQNPYHVEASGSQYGPGHRITVTIQGQVPFRGFFIQARDAATNQWIGTWDPTPNTNVHPECSSVTHGDPKDKQQATLIWVAPNNAQPGHVYFTGTVLKDYGTFWSDVVARVAEPGQAIY